MYVIAKSNCLINSLNANTLSKLFKCTFIGYISSRIHHNEMVKFLSPTLHLLIIFPYFLTPEIEAKYEKKMRTLREELELRRKTEIHEIEERKNSQINTLMRNHEKAFSDIKNYYNDITLNNLALINSLKVIESGSILRARNIEIFLSNLIFLFQISSQGSTNLSMFYLSNE